MAINSWSFVTTPADNSWKEWQWQGRVPDENDFSEIADQIAESQEGDESIYTMNVGGRGFSVGDIISMGHKKDYKIIKIEGSTATLIEKD